MREGFFFCICPDSEIIKDFIDNRISSLPGNWKKKVLWGDEEITSEFLRVFQNSSLLGENIYLVLRKAELAPMEFWDALSPLLKRFNPDVFPFFCVESDWKKGKPSIPEAISKKKYYLFAKKKKWIFLHEGVTPAFTSQYVRQWAKKRSLTIPPETLHYMLEIFPPYLAGIKKELEKLEVQLKEKNILEPSDMEVISPFLKQNTFEIINTIESWEPSSTQKLISLINQANYTSREEILPFLHLLFREARILWKIYWGEKTPLPNWVVNKKIPIARRLGKEGLQKIWNILVEAEISLKSSHLSPSEKFYHMVMELHRLFLSPSK